MPKGPKKPRRKAAATRKGRGGLRSEAAKKGWATRRVKAEARSQAAKKGWLTRLSNLLKSNKPAKVKRSTLHHTKGFLWRRGGAAPGKTERLIWDIPVPGKYGDVTPFHLKMKLRALFDLAVKETTKGNQVVVKWGAGCTYRISRYHSDEDTNGEQIEGVWEKPDTRQRAMKKSLKVARQEGGSWLGSFAEGERMSDLGDHAYRIWVTRIIVIAHVLLPKVTGKRAKREKKERVKKATASKAAKKQTLEDWEAEQVAQLRANMPKKMESIEEFSTAVQRTTDKGEPAGTNPIISTDRLIYRVWKQDPRSLTLKQFQERVAEAHRLGLLSVRRLDLPELLSDSDLQDDLRGRIQRGVSQLNLINRS